MLRRALVFAALAACTACGLVLGLDSDGSLQFDAARDGATRTDGGARGSADAGDATDAVDAADGGPRGPTDATVRDVHDESACSSDADGCSGDGDATEGDGDADFGDAGDVTVTFDDVTPAPDGCAASAPSPDGGPWVSASSSNGGLATLTVGSCSDLFVAVVIYGSSTPTVTLEGIDATELTDECGGPFYITLYYGHLQSKALGAVSVMLSGSLDAVAYLAELSGLPPQVSIASKCNAGMDAVAGVTMTNPIPIPASNKARVALGIVASQGGTTLFVPPDAGYGGGSVSTQSPDVTLLEGAVVRKGESYAAKAFGVHESAAYNAQIYILGE